VVFREGGYAPNTSEDRRLMAHELVHVVQQTGSTSLPVFQAQSGLLQCQSEKSVEKNLQQKDDPCSKKDIWDMWDAMQELGCAFLCDLNPFAGKECGENCSAKYGPWAKIKECRKRHPLPPQPDIWNETP